MNIIERLNSKGDIIKFYYDFGRGKGQRPPTGIFIYAKPKDQIQKNHNKESLRLLELKKSQKTIEAQSIGTPYIPPHKFKANFLDYYAEYVKLNQRNGNRHLTNSLNQFKRFINKDFISPTDITENLCKRFRTYLLDKFTGETPLNYYARFKWVINAATADKYFILNPVDKLASKSNPSKTLKEILETEDYMQLLATPCRNEEVKAAFLFCCYTGLRWVDAQAMTWADIKGDALTTRLVQAKTGEPVVLTLHPIAKGFLDAQAKKRVQVFGNANRVFLLPTANGANKILQQWVDDTGIGKKTTWSCARLSFSVLLQDKNIDDATVAYLLGHKTTEQVRRTYKRHRPKDQMAAIRVLPCYPMLN